MRPRPLTLFPKQLFIYFLPFLMLILCSCQQQENTPASVVVRPVKTMLIEKPVLTIQRSFPGKVQAKEKVNLAFQVPGRLINFPIKKGQRVQAGEALGMLDSRDYQSNVKASEAAFRRAEADYNRAKALLEKKLISPAEIDRQEATRDVAAANLEKARKALNDTVMLAPFTGVIADTFVDNFEDIKENSPVLSLQDTSSLDIAVQAPEKLVATEADGDIELFAIFEALPGQRFPLTIKEFATQANPGTQTFEYILSMERPPEHNILPGMTVSVEGNKILNEQTDGEFIFHYIPATAVFTDPQGKNIQYVWLVTPQMTVTKRQVSTGQLSENQIAILSGIKEGDRIVTAGVHYLEENQTIRIITHEPS